MEPIVDEIQKKYRGCIKLERVNYHSNSTWHELLFPIGSPEFALLDSSKEIIQRWFGVVEPEEFAEILDPLCRG
jgi:hypothetical protein